jgi:hypothetical protein
MPFFTKRRIRIVMLLGIVCIAASAGVPRSVLSRDARLLGMTRSGVERTLGRAVQVDVTIEPPVTFYCVTGTYEPVIYDHDGHWVRGAPTSLGGNSAGPCGSQAETLVVRYDASERVMAAGYLTVHGNTYDRGWSDSLDRLILGQRDRELFSGATAVHIPGVTVQNGPHAMRLPTGAVSVVFEAAGDPVTMGRLAIILFVDQRDVKADWLRLLEDQAIWGR